MSELQRLVDLVELKLSMLPAYDTADRSSWDAHKSAIGKIVDHLVEHEGARINDKWDGCSIKLAGIRTTCTAGAHGALRNWQTAARRKIGDAP